MRGVIISKQRCKGCDCRNETREPEQTGSDYTLIDWPCVDDVIAPMSYFALFECSHPHPEGGTSAFGDPMHHAVAELRKECLTGYKYSQEPGAPAPVPTHPVHGFLLETTPPTVPGTNAIVRPRWVGDTFFGGLRGGLADITDESEIGRYWTLLDVTASPVQMTWLGSSLVPAPVYESVNAWNLWGRNEMRLTEASQALWPSLKHNVCVATGDRPTLHNACVDAVSRCKCRDMGADDANLLVTLDCGGFGTYSATFIRFKTADGLPCGINFPDDAPCGLFADLGGAGGSPGYCAGTPTQGSAFNLTFWCDSDGIYHVEAYCKHPGTGSGSLGDECWVSQGEAVVTQSPRCKAMRIDFVLPPLECCCADGVSSPCCLDYTVPSTLTVELSGTGCADFVCNVTYNEANTRWEGTVTVCGDELFVAVQCDPISSLGFYVGADFLAPNTGTFFLSDVIEPVCDPFLLESDVNCYPAYGIADCCSGGIGLGHVTVTA